MRILITLFLIVCIASSAFGQSSKTTNYGNNPLAGKYLQVNDAKIYYEVYGSGKPVVLLHGGVYGYIDEFTSFIDSLSKNMQVICVATRGHGKSEIGDSAFTWEQRANDAYQIILRETKEKLVVLGFSDGGLAAIKLASTHPEVVSKLVVIGSGYTKPGTRNYKYNSKQLLKEAPGLFESRLALMPEPKRWDDCLKKLNNLYNKNYLSQADFKRIVCPTLIMAGDRDEYSVVEDIVKTHRLIKGSQLSIINGCSHVVFFCNWTAVWAGVHKFLS